MMKHISHDIFLLFLLFICSTGFLSISANSEYGDYSMLGVSTEDTFTFVVERYEGVSHFSILNALAPLERIFKQEGAEFNIRVTNTSVNFSEFDDPSIDVVISNSTNSVNDIIEISFGSFIINTDWEFWAVHIGDNQSIILAWGTELWEVIDNVDEFNLVYEFEYDFIFSNSSTITLPTMIDIRYAKTTGVLNYLSVNSTYLDNNEIKSYYISFRNKAYNFTPLTDENKTDIDDPIIDFSISSITIYFGLITFIGSSSLILAYSIWNTRRISFPINMKILKILDPLIKNSPALVLLLHSRSESVDVAVEKEFQEIIPPQIFQYKFLLHPVRLSITKLLYDKGTLSTFELKEIMEIPSRDVNNQLKSLENKNYIEIEVTFINDSPKKIIHLTQLGLEKYRVLSNLLSEFASN